MISYEPSKSGTQWGSKSVENIYPCSGTNVSRMLHIYWGRQLQSLAIACGWWDLRSVHEEEIAIYLSCCLRHSVSMAEANVCVIYNVICRGQPSSITEVDYSMVPEPLCWVSNACITKSNTPQQYDDHWASHYLFTIAELWHQSHNNMLSTNIGFKWIFWQEIVLRLLIKCTAEGGWMINGFNARM